MTRLKPDWIKDIQNNIESYNKRLEKICGANLAALSMDAVGIDPDAFNKAMQETKVFIVPVTQGEGVIEHFVTAIKYIVKSMGFCAYTTQNTDVEGVYEATKSGADVLFMADDKRYIALNIKMGAVGENDYCTALGYVSAFERLLNKNDRDIKSESILQVGYGRVGKIAYDIMKDKGYDVFIYDKDKSILPKNNTKPLIDISDFKNYNNIIDFTNEGGWLKGDNLSKETLYASPGVPLSLDENAISLLEGKAVYDNLEIGTAVMLAKAIV